MSATDKHAAAKPAVPPRKNPYVSAGVLHPSSQMVHYATAADVPAKIAADDYGQLDAVCSKYMTDEHREKVERAYCFAAEKHQAQRRRSGELYINHPVEVALILAELKMDSDVVCAALLHDTVEDTDTSVTDVSAMFGETVAELVDGVTKLTNIDVDTMDEKQALNLRKMFLAMSKDIRVVIIKLADRLHNMRTLAALAPDRRVFKARETMDVYAPLADRLGMSSIKWELEDLSFFYLEPEAYQRIARMVAESREARERYLAETIKILTDELKGTHMEGFQINGRPKHYWSIYQKMNKKGKEFSEICDLIALRIITHTVGDCYSALGAVHSLWHPMPGRFKDYIAMPKFNNYQSLHTTVIGPAARPLEIQIRTYEMHEQAEYGTNKNAKPSRDWFAIVKTPSARSKIRRYFAAATKDDDAAQGRDALAKELRKRGYGISTQRSTRALTTITEQLNYKHLDDLFAAIGTNKVTVKAVANRVQQILDPAPVRDVGEPLPPHRPPAKAPSKRRRSNSGVVVKGADASMLVRLAHCCNPVAGDDIVGFITRGRGVSVHRANCPNVKGLMEHPERMIEVEWDTSGDALFQVEIVVECLDRMGLLKDVTIAIGDAGGNILSAATSTDRDGIARLRFLIEISDVSRLDPLLAAVSRVPSVYDARRLMPGEGGTQMKRR